MSANFYRILNAYKLDYTPLCRSIFAFKDSTELQNALQVCGFLKLQNESFPNFYYLSDFRAKKGDDLRSYSFELSELLINLSKFYRDKNAILLAPIHSLLNPLPSENLLQSIHLKLGGEYHFATLQRELLNYGFENLELVYAPKEMSIHGDIIDVYPPNYDNPLRISFFDNEIESIKFFEPSSQMCFGEELDEVEIFPALFSLSEAEFERIDELAKNSEYDAFIKDIHSLGLWFINGEILSKTHKMIVSPNAKAEIGNLSELEILQDSVDFSHFMGVEVMESVESYKEIEINQNNIEKILLLHSNKRRILLSANTLLLQTLKIPSGVEVIQSGIALNIITPDELIVSLNKLSKAKVKSRPKIVLNELNSGDYVVHDDYGIGIFRGIVQTSVLGNVADFIEIVYLNDDKLLLPTHNLNLISKYVAGTSLLPSLDRLGKGSFARIKEKIRPKLLEIAKEIVDIAAARELIKGKKIIADSADLLNFKASSNFELTSDQERSIGEILGDLSSGRVMDRLLIGDVGFGKTEVAMNAIFGIVKSSFQAALIVPTTLLSLQHFNTLKDRFSHFGIKVAKLDRYTSNKTSISEAISRGEIDVVVGTHSIFGVSFKNLGLVVLDEEHKFGVKQKEQLKNLTKDVHILSMSATPIPRTLNMALSNIKSKSELNTPPSSRIPPKTFVKNYDDLIMKDAILRELRRNGQVFYIHNNIASIESRKAEILKILPNLKIEILHSKVPQAKSEEIMMKFACAKCDVLLSTSIVESGIHLPNANTIIIDGADCFGIADLHQLRGRIGRGDKEGYCYFFVDDKDFITQDARDRLLSLESNSFLGSGGALSYNDLEIRGGGNILGEAQSGHIKNIGYGLYLKMLEESINELSGKSVEQGRGVDIKLSISAFINPSVIPSDKIRLDLYRRLSNVALPSEVYEIESEMVDRFGRLDNFSLNFLQLILIKVFANRLGVKSIMNYNQNISIIYHNGEKESVVAPEIDDSLIVESTLSFLRDKDLKG